MRRAKPPKPPPGWRMEVRSHSIWLTSDDYGSVEVSHPHKLPIAVWDEAFETAFRIARECEERVRKRDPKAKKRGRAHPTILLMRRAARRLIDAASRYEDDAGHMWGDEAADVRKKFVSAARGCRRDARQLLNEANDLEEHMEGRRDG